MSGTVEPKHDPTFDVDELQKHNISQSNVLVDANLMANAFDAENREPEVGVWEAVKTHPMACSWAFIFCFTIVMESFDMFLNGNLVALTPFKKKYGVYVEGDTYVIPTKWQSTLFQSGQCGIFIGVFLAEPVTNRLGYRWTTILALIAMNATIFISFFKLTGSLWADSLAALTIGQSFEGVPWGISIANSPAYASEVCPLVLRGAFTGTLQMSWSIGSIIVAVATHGYNKRNDEWAWRVPLALQWIFRTPLLLLVFFAPESPWWLIRRGRKDQAFRSIRRLGRKSTENAEETLAMMERTVEIEAKMGRSPILLDLVVTCLVYASQNFAGNLIANQAIFFFEQTGMSTDFSFQLNLINSCIQFFANIGSWFLSGWFGRRTIYLWGTAFNFTMLILLGICASIKQNHSTNYTQACLGGIISFVYAGTLRPISYSIIAETSSVRPGALSTGVGRAAYYIAEIPMIYLASRMLNPTGWNLLKHRSYREVDILFNRKVPARKFKTTIIDVRENE